jgi:MFS family permease
MSFMVCMAIAILATWISNQLSDSAKSATAEGKHLRRKYLIVYYLAMAGDWLQGPYVYALYSSYGIAHKDIAVLFVAGFGSSMVFGTFIGAMADSHGRKRSACLYASLYIASCCTKHFNNYWILMLGRILGGISTSILFSAFESWVVSESNTQGVSGELSQTFSLAQVSAHRSVRTAQTDCNRLQLTATDAD